MEDGSPSLFIEVTELSQEGSFICALGISNLHISTIFLLNDGTVPKCDIPTSQRVENRNILLWLKCVLTVLYVICMILFDKYLSEIVL
jgi:hypothetical protein